MCWTERHDVITSITYIRRTVTGQRLHWTCGHSNNLPTASSKQIVNKLNKNKRLKNTSPDSQLRRRRELPKPPKDSAPEQLPKRPHRGHYTLNKNSCKNVNTQEEVTTSAVQNKTKTTRDEKQRTKQRITTKWQNLQANPTRRQYRASVHKATPANEHNCPYPIRKAEVPQH